MRRHRQQQVDHQQQTEPLPNTLHNCLEALKLITRRLIDHDKENCNLFIIYDIDNEAGFVNLGFAPAPLLALIEQACAELEDELQDDDPESA